MNTRIRALLVALAATIGAVLLVNSASTAAPPPGRRTGTDQWKCFSSSTVGNPTTTWACYQWPNWPTTTTVAP